MTPSWRLDSAEKAHLDQQGYVVREEVFARDEVDQIVEECESLVERLVASCQGARMTMGSYVFEPDVLNQVTIKWEGDSDVVHGLEPFAHLSEEIRRWANDPRFIEPAIDFVGDDDPILFTEKLNLKRSEHGGVNPLHQDQPYWVGVAEEMDRVVTAVLFLDDADLGNGCIEVLAGSHRDGVWPTRTDGDFFHRYEIDPAGTENLELTPVEVPAGSLLLFGPYLVHRSAPNRSDRQRRAILFSYQPRGLPHMLDYLRNLATSGTG
jgi:ectoine hydroxylase